MTYSVGPNLPAFFREQLPTRFTIEEFRAITGYTGSQWHCVERNWLWEQERPDPFARWRNPEGFYNPNHGRNLLTGFDDKIDKVSRLADANV